MNSKTALADRATSGVILHDRFTVGERVFVLALVLGPWQPELDHRHEPTIPKHEADLLHADHLGVEVGGSSGEDAGARLVGPSHLREQRIELADCELVELVDVQDQCARVSGSPRVVADVPRPVVDRQWEHASP
ncbi:MAG: hypothetical protein V4755_07550 [Curtobacterium sp.]